jgi:hypothetical protein
MGGVKENAHKIPLPRRGVDEVDAGVSEADGGEFDASAPERADTQSGTDGVGADDRLGAEGGVFVDDEFFEGEAGEWEKIQAYLVEMDRAAEAGADAVGDALLIAVDADERREQNEEEDDKSREGEIEKAAERVDAERGQGIRGRVFALLVGWIRFLHRSVGQLFVAGCWLLVGCCRRTEPTTTNN